MSTQNSQASPSPGDPTELNASQRGEKQIIMWKNHRLHFAVGTNILQFVRWALLLIPDRYRLRLSSCVVTVLAVFFF